MAVILSYTPISTSPDTLPSQISVFTNSEQLNGGLRIYFYFITKSRILRNFNTTKIWSHAVIYKSIAIAIHILNYIRTYLLTYLLLHGS